MYFIKHEGKWQERSFVSATYCLLNFHNSHFRNLTYTQ